MLLLDENVSPRLVGRLAPLFPGTQCVERVPELGAAATDRAIWTYGKSHNLAIVTKDKDFAELFARFGHPPKVILLKIGNARVQALEDHIRQYRGKIAEFLNDPSSGLLVV
jgi:predicted nuclease of predicted toxin-antitoxin system